MAPRETQPVRPAPGGQATINGILYQLLWSVREVQRLRFAAFADERGAISATVILEPRDGGDFEIRVDGERRVDQLKSCAPGYPWPLSKVIEKVLPDLYGAVRLDLPAQYRFVTEGKAGRWQGFFRLRDAITKAPEEDPPHLDMLPDEDTAYRGKGEYWGAEPYSTRSLFEFIARRIRERRRLRDAETTEETHRKLWSLLARFDIEPLRPASDLKREIDGWLVQLVTEGKVDAKRRELVTALAEFAVEGAEVTLEGLLADAGLTSVPLGKRDFLLERAREHLRGHLDNRRYTPNLDVRLELAANLARESRTTPIQAICGESGMGKSWLGYAVAQALADAGEFVVHLDSSGDVERDLDRAAQLYLEEIAGRDESDLSLSRLAVHLARYERPHRRVLTVVLDGIQWPEVVGELARQSWGKWRMGLVALASSDVGEAMRRALGDHGQVKRLREFTAEERNEYLSKVIGDAWQQIPEDVLGLLKNPLLAHLYCELAGAGAWKPENEYELFDRFWREKLTGGDAGRDAKIRDGLIRLAGTVVDDEGGASRPDPTWNDGECIDAFRGGETLEAALRSGWWTRFDESRYGFAHDRLMNWCVAKALAEAPGGFDIERLNERLREIERPGRQFAGRRLGYVALDAVWMISRSSRATPEETASVLQVIESGSGATGTLYDGAVRTIGPQIAPALMARLKQEAENDYVPLVKSIVSALAEVGGPEVQGKALEWLGADLIGVRAAGVRLLEVFPTLDAADALWQLLCDLEEDADRARASLERDHCRRALAACVQGAPDWIRVRVQEADPEREPVYHLARLLLGRPDGAALWRELKATLKEAVGGHRWYVLAINARRHRDLEEVGWLRERIREGQEESDAAAGIAFGALVALDTDAALEEIEGLSDFNLYLTRSQGFQRLLELRAAETLAALKARLDSSEDPIFLLQVFQGRVNQMDEEVMGKALALLAGELRREVAEDERRTHKASRCMDLLAGVTRPDLLTVLEAAAGGELENALLAWLEHQGPRMGNWAVPGRKSALCLLDRMGGHGLTEIVNVWLGTASEYAVYDGTKHAHKRPNDTTKSLLLQLCSRKSGVGTPLGSDTLAFQSLARFGAWNEVIQGLRDSEACYWGFFKELFEDGAPDSELPECLVDSVRRAAEDPSGPLGAIGALGIIGRVEMAPTLQGILRAAEPGSTRFMVALFGYCMLQAADGVDPELVRPLLRAEDGRGLALWVLGRLETGEALDALASELDRQYDGRLAVYLSGEDRTRSRGLAAIWEHVRSMSPRYAPPGVELLAELDDPEAREWVRDGAFESTVSIAGGDPEGYVRGLAKFDPAAAFVAAERRVRAASASERGERVSLLVDLDPVRGTTTLLDLVETERSHVLLRTIADVLGKVRDEPGVSEALEGRLMDWTASDDPGLRARACRFAGWLGGPEEIVSRLPGLLTDPDASIADAAWEALGEVRRSQDHAALLRVIEAETDHDRRRRLVDCSLEVGDLGTVGFAPDWVQEEFRRASSRRRKELVSLVKDGRKERAKALQERDRRGW